MTIPDENIETPTIDIERKKILNNEPVDIEEAGSLVSIDDESIENIDTTLSNDASNIKDDNDQTANNEEAKSLVSNDNFFVDLKLNIRATSGQSLSSKISSAESLNDAKSVDSKNSLKVKQKKKNFFNNLFN